MAPGDLTIGADNPSGADRHLVITIDNLTGANGTITFSLPITEYLGAPFTTNAVCGANSCTFGGVVSPAIVRVHVHTAQSPLTVQLLDSSNAVVGTYTSPWP